MRAETNLSATGSGVSLIHAVAIFVAFAAGHFLSYALRSVNATLAPFLTADLGLTPADLGWLSAAYFVSFAALQYPLGIWLDRYGERRVEAMLLVIAAVGSLLIAVGGSLTALSWGRILVGLGVSACLMAPFTYFRRNFPPQKQAQLGLWLLVAGTSGAVTSTWPAAAMAQALGWRSVFALIAALLLAVAAAVYFIVPSRPTETATKPKPAKADPALAGQPDSAALAGQAGATTQASAHASIFKHPAVTRVMPLLLVGHGGMVALQTLWIGPWLTQILGMSSNRMASTMFAFMLTLMVAYLAMSFITPRLQQRNMSLQRIAYLGHLGTVITLFVIAFLPLPGTWWLWFILAAIAPALSLMQPGLSILFPREMAGRILTLCNLFMFSGAFFMQWGIGLVIDGLHLAGLAYERAYPAAFMLLASLHLLTLLWFRFRGGHR